VGEEPLLPKPIPLTDPRVKAFRAECRPFEDPSSVREAARVAREPVPFTAHIRTDAEGRTYPSMTWVDAEDDADGR
jgi:hypothetical protein